MKGIWKWTATCFGIGFIPLAPGTAASFAAVLMYKFVLSRISWEFYSLILLCLIAGGILISTAYSKELKERDPRQVVIDEVCGQFAVLFLVPVGWRELLLSFLLFRFFDVLKPYPVKKAEELPRGWGIMTDDLVAALYAGVLLHLYLYLR